MFETLPTWQIYLFLGMLGTFLLAGGITAFIVVDKVRWKFKVNILENLSGKGYVVTRKDRSRLVGFGDGGEEVFLLKRHKVFRIGYGKRIANNTIAWAIGQDGYWYNFQFGDLDIKLLELGVMPVDRDMRFANASLRKGIETRYNQKTFFEKWGVTIMIGMLIIAFAAMGATMYFNYKKQIELRKVDVEVMKVNKEVIESVKQMLAETRTGGGKSGIVPAVPGNPVDIIPTT